MWLYLPVIFVLFGIHVYVVHIDKAFPLMMANGVLWWFFWTNVIGFLFIRRWYKKKGKQEGLDLYDLGVSFERERLSFGGVKMAKTILLAAILGFFAYGCEHLIEAIFIVDYRFIFPFASDLTTYRAAMCLRYFPFVFIGRKHPTAYVYHAGLFTVFNTVLFFVPLEVCSFQWSEDGV